MKYFTSLLLPCIGLMFFLVGCTPKVTLRLHNETGEAITVVGDKNIQLPPGASTVAPASVYQGDPASRAIHILLKGKSYFYVVIRNHVNVIPDADSYWKDGALDSKEINIAVDRTGAFRLIH